MLITDADSCGPTQAHSVRITGPGPGVWIFHQLLGDSVVGGDWRFVGFPSLDGVWLFSFILGLPAGLNKCAGTGASSWPENPNGPQGWLLVLATLLLGAPDLVSQARLKGRKL